MLRTKNIIFVLVCLIAGPVMAQESKVTSLVSKDLREFSGKEGLMITVEYAPGGSDPVHRHKAHAFVYVLEGSVVMQVKGGKEVTLTRGQTFYEGPNDVHVISRNASSTEPAKFLVFFVKDRHSGANSCELTAEVRCCRYHHLRRTSSVFTSQRRKNGG